MTFTADEAMPLPSYARRPEIVQLEARLRPTGIFRVVSEAERDRLRKLFNARHGEPSWLRNHFAWMRVLDS